MALTDVGPLLIATKSANGVTVVTKLLELLELTGSVVVLPVSAELVNVPLVGAVTVTVKLEVAPLANGAEAFVQEDERR